MGELIVLSQKIAITSNTSWYLYNFRRKTIAAMVHEGYQVFAIAPYDEYSARLADLGCKFIHVPIDAGGKYPVNDIKTFLKFCRIYFKIKPDVVLNFTPKNNIYSTLAGKLAGAACINNIAGLGVLFINENLASKLARILYRISQPLARKLFFQNEDDRQLFLKHGIAPAKITDRLPGSGADLTRFKYTAAPDDGVVRFLLIARMLYDKGIQQYVEAAAVLKANYPNTEFLLLGFLDVDNPSAVSERTMDTWVSMGNVKYLGTSDAVEDEIARVDCVVLPSYYREGVPKSLLEAGAMGKPLVTTDNVGCRETVDDGMNGFLCAPRSSQDLACKMEKIILAGHQQRLMMGQRSRDKMEREFDERVVINKYLDAIKEVLKMP
ncbi:glycosyltransferase family 4 protein [Endozoicomonas sp. SCSIO W0465]|uniref:glycosyltransferase family 4 protein n=1 Tax=Endozoicomonas sp. SCSIO W0465 TaxID=2918516 RepID=UPI0020763627|nr:glycosyltransferase family 4 protein [Endozoicomonas sp. SCSIO W0465]USE39420.1 glycosyltransferase family 4 protein [Endozoicomonas sp. SCSIO W0465]